MKENVLEQRPKIVTKGEYTIIIIRYLYAKYQNKCYFVLSLIFSFFMICDCESDLLIKIILFALFFAMWFCFFKFGGFFLTKRLNKKIGKTIGINLFTRTIHMNDITSGDSNSIINEFYNDFLNIDLKFLNRNVKTLTHHIIIEQFIKKMQDNGYKVEKKYDGEIEYTKKNGEKRKIDILGNCDIFVDNNKYTIKIKYKKQRYLYETAYISKNFSDYIAKVIPKRCFYNVYIPKELLTALKE